MKILKHLRTDWFRYGFETLAVVVGILVAFALDNWSETKHSQKEMIATMNEIREDLVHDTVSISSTLTERSLDFHAQQRILNAIRDDIPFNDQASSTTGVLRI